MFDLNAVMKKFSPTTKVLAYTCTMRLTFVTKKGISRALLNLRINSLCLPTQTESVRYLNAHYFFLLWKSTNDKVQDLFQQELHTKFPDYLVFFPLNFFQGLLWEFGYNIKTISSYCLVLIQSPYTRTNSPYWSWVILTIQFWDDSLNPLYCFLTIMFGTVRRNVKLITHEATEALIHDPESNWSLVQLSPSSHNLNIYNNWQCLRHCILNKLLFLRDAHIT